MDKLNESMDLNARVHEILLKKTPGGKGIFFPTDPDPMIYSDDFIYERNVKFCFGIGVFMPDGTKYKLHQIDATVKCFTKPGWHEPPEFDHENNTYNNSIIIESEEGNSGIWISGPMEKISRLNFACLAIAHHYISKRFKNEVRERNLNGLSKKELKKMKLEDLKKINSAISKEIESFYSDDSILSMAINDAVCDNKSADYWQEFFDKNFPNWGVNFEEIVKEYSSQVLTSAAKKELKRARKEKLRDGISSFADNVADAVGSVFDKIQEVFACAAASIAGKVEKVKKKSEIDRAKREEIRKLGGREGQLY